MMAFTPIGDALQRKISDVSPLRRQVEASLVIECAEQVLADLFGVDRAKYAKPLFLKNKTLTITCSSAAMAQEVRLKQGIIVDTINQKIGKKEVDRIRYLA